MLKDRKGSLTVEAVLILPVFIAAILFVSYFIKAYYVHDVVQDALTEAVTEVSSLSYPYYLSGAWGFKDEIHSDTEAHMETLRENFGEVSALIDSVQGKPPSGEGTAGLSPREMFHLAKLYGADKGLDCAEDTLGRALILSTMGDILSANGESVIERMDALGIENGLDGFDFTDSVFYGDDEMMDIQVSYRLERLDPFGIVQDVTLRNRVVCRAWMGGVDINNDGSYSRITVPPRQAKENEESEQEPDRILRTCYIIRDSQSSDKYHFHDCPNLRVRGDSSRFKNVAPVQVSFIRDDGRWEPEDEVAYNGKSYDLCGNCQSGIIRMKD